MIYNLLYCIFMQILQHKKLYLNIVMFNIYLNYLLLNNQYFKDKYLLL